MWYGTAGCGTLPSSQSALPCDNRLCTLPHTRPRAQRANSVRMHPIIIGTITYFLLGAVANVLCMFWPAAMKDRGCATSTRFHPGTAAAATAACVQLLPSPFHTLASVPLTNPCPRPHGPKHTNDSLTNLLVWTTTVCLWLMWVITYCMQMNPLIEPIPKVFGGAE